MSLRSLAVWEQFSILLDLAATKFDAKHITGKEEIFGVRSIDRRDARYSV